MILRIFVLLIIRTVKLCPLGKNEKAGNATAEIDGIVRRLVAIGIVNDLTKITRFQLKIQRICHNHARLIEEANGIA